MKLKKDFYAKSKLSLLLLYSGVIHLFIQSWIGPIILVLQLVCSLEVVLSSHCYTSFGWEYRDYVNGYFTESMTAERLSLRTTKYRINSDKSLLTNIPTPLEKLKKQTVL